MSSWLHCEVDDAFLRLRFFFPPAAPLAEALPDSPDPPVPFAEAELVELVEEETDSGLSPSLWLSSSGEVELPFATAPFFVAGGFERLY